MRRDHHLHNHLLKNPAEFESEFDEGLQAYRDSGIRVQFNPGVRNDNPFVYGDNAAFLSNRPDRDMPGGRGGSGLHFQKTRFFSSPV